MERKAMDIEVAREILKIQTGSPEELLERCNAIWIYSGQEREPHALLTSGKHSEGYINLNAVLQFPNLCEILAGYLIQKLEKQGIIKENIDAVVSPTFAEVTLGEEVARQLKAMFVFTEKKGREQRWTERFELPQGTRILLVEGPTTTLGTARKVKEVILNNNPMVEFIELNGKAIVATVIHRPNQLSISYPDCQVISLIAKEIHSWSPEECSLCEKGSEPLEPKPNWKKFIAYRLSGTL